MNRNRAILLGGFLMALMSNLPVVASGNCFCCMYFIGGGALAAHLTWRYAHEPLDTRYGGLIGFLTGLVCVPFDMIFKYLMFTPEDVRAVVESARVGAPPAMKEFLAGFMEYGQSRIGMAVMSGFIAFILASIFSTAGGAIVGHYKSRPPAPPQNYYQYPPTEPPKPPPFVPPDTSSQDEGSGI